MGRGQGRRGQWRRSSRGKSSATTQRGGLLCRAARCRRGRTWKGGLVVGRGVQGALPTAKPPVRLPSLPYPPEICLTAGCRLLRSQLLQRRHNCGQRVAPGVRHKVRGRLDQRRAAVRCCFALDKAQVGASGWRAFQLLRCWPNDLSADLRCSQVAIFFVCATEKVLQHANMHAWGRCGWWATKKKGGRVEEAVVTEHAERSGEGNTVCRTRGGSQEEKQKK